MAHTIETIAPWLKPDEAQDMIDHIQSIPIIERTDQHGTLATTCGCSMPSGRRCSLWTMLPVDMTDEQLESNARLSHARGERQRASERRQNAARNISLS